MIKKMYEVFRIIFYSTVVGYIGYFTAATMYPIEIAEFHDVMRVHGPVKAGDWTTYRNRFHKKYNCYGEVSRQLTDNKGAAVPLDVVPVTMPPGEWDVLVPVQIPDTTPPGTYRIMFFYRWTLNRPMLPPRLIEKRLESSEFVVTPGRYSDLPGYRAENR